MLAYNAVNISRGLFNYENIVDDYGKIVGTMHEPMKNVLLRNKMNTFKALLTLNKAWRVGSSFGNSKNMK